MTADYYSNKQISNNNVTSWLIPVLISSTVSIATLGVGYWYIQKNEKYNRSRWLEEVEMREEDDAKEDLYGETEGHAFPSVIRHFKSLELTSQSTILEANRRRTTSYYNKQREATKQSLVLGIPEYTTLLKNRRAEIDHLLSYYRQGKKSLRTVIIMLDNSTQQVLSEARQKILQPLDFSWDIYTKGVWIPELNIIPKQDMHVSVACPWWWHTMREGNRELSQDLANRLRQTLVVDFHYPFLIELERFVLLGGKSLVALWRTVGERTTEEDITIIDRHATTIDPMVRLRNEILDCFTNEQNEYNFKPLTHTHRKNTANNLKAMNELDDDENNDNYPPPPVPPKGKVKRRHTIEMKTPGIGSGDGFIHTSLCRLPLDCFSMTDIELEPIHRLCREATATYGGHRMLVHKFRFLETTGESGDSNPCAKPLFDETMTAPIKVVPQGGQRTEGVTNADRNAYTTGRVRNNRRTMADTNGMEAAPASDARKTMEELFEPPSSS